MRNSPQRKGPQRQLEVHQYEGPVPPPAIVEKMEKILPGAADRIFTMAEKEQNAAHEARQMAYARAIQIEKDEHKENVTALWMAFVICLVFAVGGIILVLNGFEAIGGTLIGTTLLGVVGSFLRKKKRE